MQSSLLGPESFSSHNDHVQSGGGYKLVKLASGVHSVYSLAHRETFHPVIGPVAEAEGLYVRQLGLRERLRQHDGEFVIWDIGLGAAANALTVFRATQDIPCTIHLLSFDATLEPLEFALQHTAELDYLSGYEPLLRELVSQHHAGFKHAAQNVEWDLHLSDFPTLLTQPIATNFAKP